MSLSPLAGGSRILSRAAQWWTAPLADHLAIRDKLIATVIQRRPAVFISCAAVMIMSLSAALLTKQPWAIGWLGVDAGLISYRLYLSFRYDDGIHNPVKGRGAVIGSMLALFVIFGLGCSLSIMRGPLVLMMMAIISVLGVFAGIGWRWAALPRLALATIAAVALPVCLAISMRTGAGLALAAIQFAAIAAMTASQTMQNHRTLVRMILAEHQNGLLARSDPLTGLGNRVRLREDLGALLAGAAARAADCPVAVLYLDLDGFKAFNDAHGHEAGDELLTKVGQAICIEAEGAGVYRIGGDEFVIVCARQGASMVKLAQRIVHKVSATGLHHRSGTSTVSASIGIAHAKPSDRPETVLARADEALYAAKRAGKACCHVAEPETSTRARAA
jgi:diguanylate cyclase (GGDEF)-like protein